MDSSTAGLIGVGIGGILSLATGLLTPRVNAQLSAQQFKRETESKRLEGLEAVLDEAGLALEEVHWALREALAVLAHARSLPSVHEEADSRWLEICARMATAQAQVSRLGTRLAIRLGAPTATVDSPCVAAYNDRQMGYRGLVREVQDPDSQRNLDLAELQRRLDVLGHHDAYLNEAAKLIAAEDHQPRPRK
jgi:hypothetical protein